MYGSGHFRAPGKISQGLNLCKLVRVFHIMTIRKNAIDQPDNIKRSEVVQRHDINFAMSRASEMPF